MGRQSPGATLQATRAAFWQAIRSEGGCNFSEDRSVITYMLPTDMRNSRKAPVTSEGFMHPIPCSIPPASARAEEAIISALINELNEDYGLGLNPYPTHSRTYDPVAAHDTGKTVFVGASHMRRVSQSCRPRTSAPSRPRLLDEAGLWPA